MGITASCKPGCGGCDRAENKDPSRGLNTNVQNYEYPQNSPRCNDANVAFTEEPLDGELFDVSKPKVSTDWQEAQNDSTPLKDQVYLTMSENSTPTADLAGKLEPDKASPNAAEQKQEPEDSKRLSETKREVQKKWKSAAKKAIMAKNMGAKIAIANKIGTKLEGWFRDVALELQRGIAADGRQLDHPNFKAPESALFNRCRVACGFTPVRYFATMGLQDGLTEPNLALIGDKDAAGRSGSFFFLSPDQQLIAKSCTKEDWRQLLRILPEYTKLVEDARAKANERNQSHSSSVAVASRMSQAAAGQAAGFVRGFTETLLPRFLGLYKMTIGGDSKAEPVRVLVMANVFGGALSIDRRYDLKGSTHGRKASKKECAKKSPVYKDIDWVATEPALGLSRLNRQMLLEALERDLGFLAKQGLMDYSLLVGVHNLAPGAGSAYEAMNVVTVRDTTRHCYLGVIDVLTPYRFRKRAETFFLGTVVCGRDVSCQHPKTYARRFMRFVDKQILQLADGES